MRVYFEQNIPCSRFATQCEWLPPRKSKLVAKGYGNVFRWPGCPFQERKLSLNSWMLIPAFRGEGKDAAPVFRKLSEARTGRWGGGGAMGPSETCTKYVIREDRRLRLSQQSVKGALGRQHWAEERGPGVRRGDLGSSLCL